MLIDTHTHLNTKKFNETYQQVIQRALNNDVRVMIVVGFDKETNARAITLAEQHPFLYATVGFHPTEAKNIKAEDFILLRTQLQHPKVVGVGECGLDFYWDKEHKDAQIDVFHKQIMLSKEFDKPLIIHMRDATEATYQVLAEYKQLQGIMHCYSGSPEMVPLFLKLGLHISLGGPVTFKNGHKPKAVAAIIPMDKLLIETDAPYLAPHPFRGKTNEPMHVKLIAEQIAKIRNIPYDDLAKITTNNALKLFGIKEF